MRCPLCDADDTRVVDSRPSDGGAAIRRRRECLECRQRFTTYERAALVVMVRKRDGRREPYDAQKVLRGLEITLADRPVSDTDLAGILASIDAAARASGPEITADDIGKLVLDGLRDLDEVAYLRFASVHKEFQGADDFHRAMEALGDEDTAAD